jgi:hypothetical protein
LPDPGPIAEPPGAVEPVIAAGHPVEPVAAEAAIQEPAIYMPSVAGEALSCCEILSGVMQHRKSFQSLHAPEPELETITHPQCIVISQDCDLEQDFKVRQNNPEASPLPNVLLCQVSFADDLRGNVAPGKDIWKRIIQNKDERYQFLRAVPALQDAANEGLDDLGIDLRRYFSVPTDELYEQFNLGARRRCRLLSPFKEHLMDRLGYFVARVALPYDH